MTAVVLCCSICIVIIDGVNEKIVKIHIEMPSVHLWVSNYKLFCRWLQHLYIIFHLRLNMTKNMLSVYLYNKVGLWLWKEICC